MKPKRFTDEDRRIALERKALQIRRTASKEFGITLFTPQALRFARISLQAEYSISQRAKKRGTWACA